MQITGCYEEQVDYLGADIRKYSNINSKEACKTKCRQHRNCKYFTYVTAMYKGKAARAKDCFVKKSQGKRGILKGVVSGSKTCPGKALVNYSLLCDLWMLCSIKQRNLVKLRSILQRKVIEGYYINEEKKIHGLFKC